MRKPACKHFISSRLFVAVRGGRCLGVMLPPTPRVWNSDASKIRVRERIAEALKAFRAIIYTADNWHPKEVLVAVHIYWQTNKKI